MPDQTNQLREIALQKIGRNLVNLQRFERMLKVMISGGSVRGYASELANILKGKMNDTNRMTLGPLVEEFLKVSYSKDDPFNDGPDKALDEAWMSISFRIHSNEDLISKKEGELRRVVAERNLLIHQWLAELDLDSMEDCQKLISRLDEQDNRLTPHYESLKRQIGGMAALKEAVLKLLEAELREYSQAERDNS
jgi:hypothetical protein